MTLGKLKKIVDDAFTKCGEVIGTIKIEDYE